MLPNRLRAYFYLTLVVIIWGIAGPVIKLTLRVLPADTFLLYRFFLSSLIAVVIFLIRGIKLPKSPGLLIQLIIYSLLTATFSLGFLFLGLEKTSLLEMSLISVFGPVLTVLGGWLFLKDHIVKREKIGIAIAFVGSILLIIEPVLDGQGSKASLFGNLLIFLSLLSGSASAIILKKLLRNHLDPLTVVNVTFLIGFLTLIPAVIYKTGFAQSLTIIKGLPLPYHLAVIYMAVFSGTIAYFLSDLAQKSIEVSEAALFSYLYPILSAILAIWILGDKMSSASLVGSAITFIGVVLAEFKTNCLASKRHKLI
jgi:drug/metabolite transporter (DMT)-like permease